jgi:hypothetical protein
MAWGGLIDVVSGPVFKNNDQSNVKIQVVDGPCKVFFQRSGKEKPGSGVIGQILISRF